MPYWTKILAAVLLLQLSGCATYNVGPEMLYPRDIRTVYIPMFESNSYRLYLGERLTEAVGRQIRQDTPFTTVASADRADSILRGRLVSDTRHVIAENAFDQPRELETDLVIEVAWVDRNRRELRPPQRFPLPPALSTVTGDSPLVPEVGQSVATSQQEAIDRLARQIVGMMESPW